VLDDSDDEPEFDGEAKDDLGQRFGDAFEEGGGGVVIDDEPKPRRNPGRRARRTTAFENMNEDTLREKLKQFDLNELSGTERRGKNAMRERLRDLFESGKVDKDGKRIQLQPVLRF
jgi:hypothetical protein